jgi:hypothetical protein
MKVHVVVTVLVLANIAPAFASSKKKTPRPKQSVSQSVPVPRFPVGGARVYDASCVTPYLGGWTEGYPGMAKC